jgi:alpha-ketoglutarate-dependent 2,4-dichlorophenoxyacetate dioxygenase
MALVITEHKSGFFAEVEARELKSQLPDEDIETIEQAIDQLGVLVFPRQMLSAVEQVAFSRRFGPLELDVGRHALAPTQRPEVSYITNTDAEGNTLAPDTKKVVNARGNEAWHTDSSFKAIPAKYSVLCGREVPAVGGDTEFADLRAAYEDWPGSERLGVSKADLDGLVAEHSIVYSRRAQGVGAWSELELEQLGGARQSLIRVHPATGRTNFYIASHIYAILGLTQERALALKDELMAWSTQREYVHVHKWCAGDVVMWDNRCVLHRGTPWDRASERRVMHRTTVLGDAPTVAPDSPWGQPDQVASAQAMRNEALVQAAKPLP